jgi:hypothetical protein
MFAKAGQLWDGLITTQFPAAMAPKKLDTIFFLRKLTRQTCHRDQSQDGHIPCTHYQHHPQRVLIDVHSVQQICPPLWWSLRLHPFLQIGHEILQVIDSYRNLKSNLFSVLAQVFVHRLHYRVFVLVEELLEALQIFHPMRHVLGESFVERVPRCRNHFGGTLLFHFHYRKITPIWTLFGIVTVLSTR